MFWTAVNSIAAHAADPARSTLSLQSNDAQWAEYVLPPLPRLVRANKCGAGHVKPHATIDRVTSTGLVALNATSRPMQGI